MELNQYLSMFIDESKEHLQSMNDNLLNLENQPQDIAIVQQIFRSAHTLKGMSATMGFEDIASLTHEMENVLDLVRNAKTVMNSYIFDCLFKSLDALELMVGDIIQGGTGKADVSEIVSSLKSVVSGNFSATPAGSSAGTATSSASVDPGSDLDEFQYSVLEQSLSTGNQAYHIVVKLREDCILKAARAYLVFDQLEKNGEIIQSSPTVQEIEQENFDLSFSLYLVSMKEPSVLEEMVMNISEIDSVRVIPLDLDSLKDARSSKEAKTVKTAHSPDREEDRLKPAEAVPSPSELAPRPAAAQSGGAPLSGRTIRVDIERLDKLMNLFSELLIDRVRLEQLAREVNRNDLNETVEHTARVSSDLQNMVLKMRMVPVETVFNRFPRMIRDIAKSLNKKIDLIITGAETELDRTVIDEIGDPLVHLLRNAADHGLETVEERVTAGKNETGSIHLRAYQSGNHVFIEIEDDGHGINRQKVLQTALKNGLVQAEQADNMSDEQVYQLLFHSGFSTADKISDLSGRGVGLDVVKTKIVSLGGHVEVTSRRGKGTRFSVQLPLTLSIIGALLVRSGPEKYAIPLSSVVETAMVEPDQVHKVHGNSMIDFRDHLIPLVNLSKLFDVPPSDGEETPELEVVIVRKGDKMLAVEVDELFGQQEVVLKPLGKFFTDLFAVSGATILGDGQVALIVDTNALIV